MKRQSTCGELSIDVSVNVAVSDETANKCLRILEFYLNDNKDKCLVVETAEDGGARLRISGRERNEQV